MSKLTKKAVFTTFEEMLEEMPFDKITVSALVNRCGISPNTFYYHFQDIYALLEAWLSMKSDVLFIHQVNDDWKAATVNLLNACKAKPKIIDHLYHSLSSEEIEKYIFNNSEDIFYQLVRSYAEDVGVPDSRTHEIADFCRYAYVGFFLQFLWGRMAVDPQQSVDRLGILFDTFVESSIRKFELQK